LDGHTYRRVHYVKNEEEERERGEGRKEGEKRNERERYIYMPYRLNGFPFAFLNYKRKSRQIVKKKG